MKTKLKNIFYIIVVLTLFTSSLILDIHAQPKKDNQNEKKLTICHYPPGNNEKVQEIEINENSLDTHLEHEDYIKKENEECKPKVIPTPVPIPILPEPVNQPVPELVNPEPTNPTTDEPTNLLTDKPVVLGETIQPLVEEPIDEGIYSTAKPVFRFFNILGVPRHFYTINVGEYNDILKLTNEWRYEGIAYYAWTDITDINTKQITCFNGKVPVYRFFSSARANHIYTISISERDTLLNDSTYVYEGIKFCVYPSDSKDGIDPVHRFWHTINDKHFYSINVEEIKELVTKYTEGTSQWRPEGVKFYAIKALNYYNYKFDPSDITNNDKKIGESDFMCGGYKFVIYQNSSQKIQVEDYVFNPAVGSFFSIEVAHYFTGAYYEIGDHCSLLGLPIMNKATAATSPQGTNGEYQMYDNGGIYYNFKYDSTFAVFGKIFEIYEGDSGGTGGAYGFPTDGVRWYGEYNSYCQQFEEGLICENDALIDETIKSILDERFSNLSNVQKGMYLNICEGVKLDVLQSGEKVGEIFYNPNYPSTTFYINNIRTLNKYYSINNYCIKLGLPRQEQSGAAIGIKPNYYKSRNSDVKESSWYAFDYGDIYDYKTTTYKDWQTYAIWNQQIKKDYSTAGDRGFPTSDTQEDGLENCTNGIIYQRFEYRVVSVLDDVRSRNIDDNRRFESNEFSRRNNNLVCGYLNSHRTQRHTITDHQAYTAIWNYISGNDSSDTTFIKDGIVLFIGYEKIGSKAGYKYEGTDDNIYHFSVRGDEFQNHDVFSDTGFKTYLRDSKYHDGTSGFGFFTSSYSNDVNELRSNQLFHATGGTLAGWELSISRWPYCSTSFMAVEFHEITEIGWKFNDQPKNGGSMEDLIINYITAYNACLFRQKNESLYGKTREDLLDIYESFTVDGDMQKHKYMIWEMGGLTLLDNDIQNKLVQYIELNQ
jgi:hypothetical protein